MVRMWAIVVAVTALLAGVFPAHAAVLSLSPDGDAWLSESSPSTNYGADDPLRMVSSAGAGKVALVRFDLSSLPTGSVVHRATLRLHFDPSASTADSFALRPAAPVWDESTVRWTTFFATPQLIIDPVKFVADQDGLVEVDVMDLVQAWLDGDVDNNGFLLQAPSGSSETRANSRESATASLRPQLEVWTEPSLVLADDFRDVSFAGSTGNRPWSSDWLEFLDLTPGPAAGTLRVESTDPGARRSLGVSGNLALITRYADTLEPGYGRLLLTLDTRREAFGDNSSQAELQIQTSGTSGWTTLETFVGPGTDDDFTRRNYDISDYASDTFALRFNPQNLMDPGETLYVDDVRIAMFAVTDVALTKDVDNDTPDPGDTIEFTITATNAGAIAATNLVLVDALPDGLSFVGATPSVGSYDSTTGLWNVSDLAPGATETLLLRAQVDLDMADRVLVNDVVVKSLSEIDSNPENDSASVTVQVGGAIALGVDLAVSQTATPPSTSPGDTLAIKVRVQNLASIAATKAKVEHTLDADMIVLQRVLTKGTWNDGQKTWDLKGLDAGAEAEMVVTLRVDPGTTAITLGSSAQVLGVEPVDLNVSNDLSLLSIPVERADLALSGIAGAATANVGDALNFDFTLQNLGLSTADTVRVAVTLPAGLDAVAVTPSAGSYSAGTGIWTVTDIGVGQIRTLGVDGTAAIGSGGQSLVVVLRRIDSVPSDPNDANDEATATTRILASDLSISKNVDQANPAEGATILYTITLKNLGPDPATGVAVFDALPTGVTYATHTVDAGTYDAGSGLWSVGDAAVDSSIVLTIEATVDVGTGGATIRNEASVAAADQEDPDGLNDSDGADIGGSATDLSLAAVFDSPTADVGDTLTFTATLTNAGPVAASGIVVETQSPTGLSFVDATPERGSYDSGTEVWSVGALAVGSTTSLVVRATVEPGTGGSSLLQAARIVAMDQVELDDANDRGQASVAVRLADLSLTHLASPDRANEGDSVDFVLTVRNFGPDPLFDVGVVDSLGAGLALATHVASQGSFDPGTGRWQLGDLLADSTATLTLTADVLAGTAGGNLVATARRESRPTEDPILGNDAADALVRVPLVDLLVEAEALPASLDPGDTTTVTVAVQNQGPDAASELDLRVGVPSEFSVAAFSPSAGSFDVGTGQWAAGNLPAAGQATLEMQLVAQPGTAGTTVPLLARVLDRNEMDADAANDSTQLDLVIRGADLVVTKTVDTANVLDEDIVAWTITVENLGPNATTAAAVRDTLQPQLTLMSWDADQGQWDEGTGVWSVGDLGAGASARLTLSTRVRTGADPVRVINRAASLGSALADPVATNDSSAAFVDVAPVFRLVATASQPSGLTLEPTHAPVTVFRLRLENRSAARRTLQSVRLRNASVGDGGVAAMDSSWSSFTYQLGGTIEGVADRSTPKTMTGGSVLLDGIDTGIDPGEILELLVRANASARARDGDRLDLEITGAEDLVFAEAVDLDGLWPLDPAPTFPVDGMQAGQVQITGVEQTLLFTGTNRNVVLDWVVPANGYAPDVLHRVNLVNLGTALQSVHVERMELWADDGDAKFDPALDARIGDLVATGALWEISGLQVPIPVGGQRMFATADIAGAVDAGEPALEGRTVQFGLPVQEDLSLLMKSENDGPLDAPVVNPDVLTISTIDKITFTAAPIAAGVAHPGQDGVMLLSLAVSNTYETDETLQALEITNATSGSGSPSELDRQLERLTLVQDLDGDGAWGPGDLEIAESFFDAGRARFDNFSLTIPDAGEIQLLVLGKVSLSSAADGDVLSANVADPRDIEFTRPVALAAGFPVDSGAAWTLDGMLAAQLGIETSPTVTLGPGEGPVLGLDLRVPRNGYRDDSLVAIQLENAGTAQAADIQEIRVYRDGGDGIFTPGPGGDLDLGPLVPLDSRWVSPVLDQPVGATGARLFFGVTVSTSPTDSSTVRLRVPVDGISMASGNDGPLLEPATADGSLLLSSAPLLASLEITPGASNLGMPVELRVVVRNTSDETILSISPESLDFEGDGALNLIGPVGPTTLDLLSDEADTLRFEAVADGAGSLRLRGRVTGTGQSTGFTRASIPSLSNLHRVFLEADSLTLTPVPAAPFSVTRGQLGAVPLSLTFAHGGQASSGAILLRGLTVRVEDDAGQGIVPDAVLSAIAVSEGSVQYLRRDGLETSGETVDLPLATPVAIEPGEQTTLSFKVDVQATTLVPNFRLTILDATWLTAEDATTGGPVTVVDDGSGTTFPVRSGLATVRDEAQELRLAAPDQAPRRAVRGQSGAGLATLEFINPGVAGVTSDLRVSTLSLRWEDAAGTALPDVSTILGSVMLRQGTTAVATALVAPGDSVVSLSLVPPLSVAGADTVALRVEGDLRVDAPVGTFRWYLSPGDSVVTWDANTAENLPVVLDPSPLHGADVDVLAPADSVGVSAVGNAPQFAVLGETDVAMISVCVRHPGAAQSSPLRLDGLRVELQSATRQPLSLDSHLDRIVVRRRADGASVGATDLPGTSALDLGLPGWTLQPGETDTLEVEVDVDLGAPATSFEVVLRRAGIVVVDAISDDPAALLAADADAFPLVSGLTQLVAPARELVVDLESQMPATLVPEGVDVPVARFRLQNPAASGAGEIQLGWLTLRAIDRKSRPLDLGSWVDRLRLWQDGDVVAESAVLSADSTTATLWLAAPLAIPATSEAELALTMDTGTSLPSEGLALGVEAVDVGVLQPQSAALSVDVTPPDGSSFPLYSRAASATARNLEESFANYPNPFAAGRESTRIPFFLPGDGRVTVDVYTLDGARVIRLLDGESLEAGLHEELQWDGRNGQGDVVRNGVYLMRLRYEGSTSQELLHKVAVVR